MNNSLLANPTTNTPQKTIYYFTSLVTGSNQVLNGDFSQGNTGFTSGYTSSLSNNASGQFNISSNAGSWLGGAVVCNSDHTSGTGNMLMANGATIANTKIWAQTINVAPNTNYEISGWLSSLNPLNPSTVQFAINGIKLGTAATAANITCQWNRFATVWNSGSQTAIELSVIGLSTQASGNDFVLDDLAFAPVSIRRDSVIISIDTPRVQAGNDVVICRNDTVQLHAAGASVYSWTPANNLINSGTGNPSAYPSVTTQYMVSGSSAFGCLATDTIVVQVDSLPLITALSVDTSICRNASVQLNTAGGVNYTWQPANTLNNPFIANPVAVPASTTTYYVTVAGTNNCKAKDSITIVVKQPPVFRVDPMVNTCLGNDVQLHAYGGNTYLWSPATGLSADNVANPFAHGILNTMYAVKIKEPICNDSAILTVMLQVLPLPALQVSKSNDIDCTTGLAKLTAIGANTYKWTPGRNLSDSTSATPTATPFVTTFYSVTGRGLNGCEKTDTLTVLVKFEGNSIHYMPGAFTPNSDGLNDCFGLKNWGQVSDLKFAIYNRWGERVFYTTNPGICWDGKYKNELQQPGNFIYIIQAKTSCGAVDIKGSVVLVR